MKEFNFLAPGVKVTFYRNRGSRFAKYFAKDDGICYCKDINGLFTEFGQNHDPSAWRLFIDGSKYSLKAVLLHNGNKKPSIPIAHAVNMKESYNSMAVLLEKINYRTHNWKVCSDLKVVALLTGLQTGYTKNCCFLCKWDSRAREHHYRRKEWPARDEHIIGENNIAQPQLVLKENIILPPLHIKLGLMKNFVKALNENDDAMSYLKTVFPRLSEAKIKEGIFVGPQIRKLMNDEEFIEKLSEDEAAAWSAFQNVVNCFLGNTKSRQYEKLIDDLLEKYEMISK